MSSLALGTAAPAPATPTSAGTIIHLGMDVHKDALTMAVLPERSNAPGGWSNSRTRFRG